jgi:hypothetical protein
MAVFDVLLVSNGPLRFRGEISAREPPLTKTCQLTPQLCLSGVKEDVANAVLQLCKFRELEWDGEKALYAFVRDAPPSRRWDQDQAISEALYLSHIVHAHLAGFEFAAQVETDDRGRAVRVEPADIAPPFARAYSCPGAQRLWLTQKDGEQLREVIAGYQKARPALAESPVGDAISMFAESPFVYHGRPRAALLFATLEGLISRSPGRAVKQFTTRVPALAGEVGLAHLNRKWADRAYKLRSKLAHGGSLFRAPNHEERTTKVAALDSVITDIDELLRRILKRALQDTEFRKRVEEIDRHWPVTAYGCPTCRGREAELGTIECRCGNRWE